MFLIINLYDNDKRNSANLKRKFEPLGNHTAIKKNAVVKVLSRRMFVLWALINIGAPVVLGQLMYHIMFNNDLDVVQNIDFLELFCRARKKVKVKISLFFEPFSKFI